MLVGDEGVKDGRHEKVCDASTGIAKTASQRVGSANNVLVEEAGRPYLARDETATKDTDKEAECEQPVDSSDSPSQGGRNGANQKAAGKGVAWAEAIARWASD